MAEAIPAPAVRLGETDLSSDLVEMRIGRAQNRVELVATLKLTVRVGGFVDFADLMTIEGPAANRLFTGKVVEATNESMCINVVASSSPEMVDTEAPRCTYWGEAQMDALRMLLQSGSDGKEIVSHSDRWRATADEYEITVPVYGLHCPESIKVGKVVFTPPNSFALPRAPEVDEGLRREFESGSAFGMVRIGPIEGWLYDAEVAGRELIERALEWIRCLSSYGGSTWPDGTARNFLRVNSVQDFRVGPAAYVRSRKSSRAWVRATEPVSSKRVPTHAASLFALGDVPATSIELAVEPCARLCDWRLSPMVRLAGLWESLEYVAAAAPAPGPSTKIFSAAKLRALRRRVRPDLDELQKARFDQLVAMLNEPALMARIRRSVELSQAPITNAEFRLLADLRKIRNDALHGRPYTPPSRYDLDMAASIVTRLLLWGSSRPRSVGRSGASTGATDAAAEPRP